MSGASFQALMTGSGAAYTLQKSIILNGSTQYLSRTFGSPTSSTIFTMACWVKRAATGGLGSVLLGQTSVANNEFCFGGSGTTSGVGTDGIAYSSAQTAQVSTNTTYTNTADWYHIVFAVDTNQGTAANRMHIYVDGTEVTYAATTYPSAAFQFNTAVAHTIGQELSTWFLNGKLAAYHFVDGQQLTPSSFITGTGHNTCHPKQYGGTLGNNGFILNFGGAAIGGDDGTGVQNANSGSNTWTATGTPTTSTDVPV